jgi:hypothetical protein
VADIDTPHIRLLALIASETPSSELAGHASWWCGWRRRGGGMVSPGSW